ncbi:MAG: chorismate mutase [Clostridia bacterium]|nr:chorismate mutase [Clostridia bacterium]
MEKLEELRKRIDGVDEQICALLKERFDLVKEVGEAKKNLGVNVENKDREQEIIEAVRNRLPEELKDYAEEIYRTIFKVSKEYQKTL